MVWGAERTEGGGGGGLERAVGRSRGLEGINRGFAESERAGRD